MGVKTMAEFRTERKGDIIKCEYTVSGGIEGGAYSLRASKTGNETAELAVSNVVNQMTFDREKYYDIGIEIFDELEKSLTDTECCDGLPGRKIPYLSVMRK